MNKQLTIKFKEQELAILVKATDKYAAKLEEANRNKVRLMEEIAKLKAENI